MAMQAKAPFSCWKLFRSLLCVTAVLLACALLHAQTSSNKKSPPKNPITSVLPAPVAPAPAPTPPPPPPPDPLGRGTPHGAVLGFLRVAENGDYAQAAKYLETRTTGARAEGLAMQLKALLDLGTG